MVTMWRRLLPVLAIASAMVIAGSGHAQTTADSNSTSGAGAVAIAEGAGLNYAPVSNVTYPKNTPSMALGSFGQGANPCAEGVGFNVGASGFGIGFNNASSHAGCMRLLAARAILASAESKDRQIGHAALLV